jgi:ADP-dependent NAD(P)H-hydrate dehydratase
MDAHSDVVELVDKVLHQWSLPMPSGDGDKEARGRVLIVAGSPEMPGAAILAATAAMRAGAGKLTVATVASIASSVAVALPEARVIALPETSAGAIDTAAVDILGPLAEAFDAVLIGPGMQDEIATAHFVRALIPRLAQTKIILDAYAMTAITDLGADESSSVRASNILLTPHAGEMAHLRGIDKDTVVAQPDVFAREATQLWCTSIVLKGAVTFIATPDGCLWRHEGGGVGLASSGSGDVLAGIIAGLAARGAELAQAGVWGVVLHARAGQQLAARFGPLGYLAREIAVEIPALMRALSLN